MEIEIYTQAYENYGYRWKPKGGDEYTIEVDDGADIEAEVTRFASRNLIDNEVYQEFVAGWEIKHADYTVPMNTSEEDYEDYLYDLEESFHRAA